MPDHDHETEMRVCHNRVVSKWNSLPADDVNVSVDAFKDRPDKFWSTQEVRFNYKAQFDL